MKKLVFAFTLFAALLSSTVFAQTKRAPASLGREEYIEVEKNVRLHVTDLGEGQPLVLIHGWPLSDAMYEYQYADFLQKGYRVIGITLRGFGLSDKPAGKYNYDVFADDIKVVLDKLKIENATIGGFSMGGLPSSIMLRNTMLPILLKWHFLAQRRQSGRNVLTLIMVYGPKRMSMA